MNVRNSLQLKFEAVATTHTCDERGHWLISTASLKLIYVALALFALLAFIRIGRGDVLLFVFDIISFLEDGFPLLGVQFMRCHEGDVRQADLIL